MGLVNIEFSIGSLKITQEFIVTRLSGHHQVILGFEFLKGYNPHIDWTTGTLRFKDMDTVQPSCKICIFLYRSAIWESGPMGPRISGNWELGTRPLGLKEECGIWDFSFAGRL